ncbi:DUF4192 family protein [Amycolatopsis anabasis]|uniref:DUF4192 family protein n=1 Tax=Amycolatopsis anabasis TaxID=1840409 RepID=UPI00131ECAFF|nr:DUF4192 family protein [Amycolatopsis anabasis]
MSHRHSPGDLIALLHQSLPDPLASDVLCLVPTAIDILSTSAWPEVPIGVLPLSSLRRQSTQDVTDRLLRSISVPVGAELALVAVGDTTEVTKQRHRVAIAALETSLAERGLVVQDTFWTTHVQPGARWADDREPGRTGLVTHPMLGGPVRALAFGIDDTHRVPDWGLPFQPHGYRAPRRLSRFAEAVIPHVTSDLEHALDLVDAVRHRVDLGEMPDDVTAYALLTALRTGSVYASCVVPDPRYDPLRIEQVWLALHRAAPVDLRPRLATVVAASALGRGNTALATLALSHSGRDRVATTIATCLRDGVTGPAAQDRLCRAVSGFHPTI